jgi:hypothetical protein
MDTDMLSAIERRADSLQATDVTDLANLLFEFDGVCHAHPAGHDDPHRDPSLTVRFDADRGWRDTEPVIEICRCGGFEVRQVVFERGEIRFQPTG